MNPRVSVVMPAYQAASTIGAAISSVLSQTFRDLEIVVVDDGSTDTTPAVVAALPGPIRLIRQENSGVAVARNRGIDAANGELITFCDADDLLFDKHLETLVAIYEAHKRVVVTANSYFLFPGGIDRSRLRYKGRFPSFEEQRRAILEQNIVSIQTLFPRRLIEEIGRFDETKRRAEDWDFWMRAVFAGNRIVLSRRPLSIIRLVPTGLSSDRDAMDAEVEMVYEGIEDRFELTAEERAYLARRRMGPGPRKLGRAGDEALRAGYYKEAARLYRDAASLCPSERMLVWKARALRPAPQLLGPLVRTRQLRIERDVGFEPDHIR
ncbi:MAG: glycosyltransferase [Gaiellaceae bacterium]